MLKKIAASVLLAVSMLLGPLAAPSFAHNREDWEVAVILYKNVVATCYGVPFEAHMTSGEIANARTAVQSFESQLNTWNSRLDVGVTLIERDTLRTVSDDGDGTHCWPKPVDVPVPAGYSTTMVLIDPEIESGSGPLPAGTWWYDRAGVAYTCSTCISGGGYTTSIATQYSTPDIAEVMIHEWLHPASTWYRERNNYVPDPHWESDYGDFSSALAWYRSIVSGTLPDKNGDGYNDGITHRAVHVGAPN
jgi:hypothetical protein